ncbi:MAG: Hsp20 family protein [Rhodospirillales bacterium]|nr:Hsp20 family protein [Alphaproteobacteria bacterium]MCB9987415.1 Hsp20 family protein [Rhodospirillales bacterium]USO07603.1 MAG: Hsp20 family protein [Rhodospirillales bacterium]
MTRNQLATCDLDFSPLFRSMIGFDRLASMLDAQPAAYPPYNIEKTGEDSYQISMAVAGFGQDDLDINVENGTLIVRGQKKETSKDDGKTYLHRGIATRAFEQRFQLADHVEVKDARIEHGMLNVDLVREIPERLKPRKIAVKQGLLDALVQGGAREALNPTKAA